MPRTKLERARTRVGQLHYCAVCYDERRFQQKTLT